MWAKSAIRFSRKCHANILFLSCAIMVTILDASCQYFFSNMKVIIQKMLHICNLSSVGIMVSDKKLIDCLPYMAVMAILDVENIIFIALKELVLTTLHK